MDQNNSIENSWQETLAQIERAKQEWEATVDALSQLVCLVNRGGVILRANRAVERWGLGRVETVRGQGLHDLLHPGCADAACYLKDLWPASKSQLLAEKAVEGETEDTILNRYLQLQIQPIAAETGSHEKAADSFAVVIIRDITARKQTELALKKAHEELEQRVEERTTELSTANAALKQQIAVRKQAEATLKQRAAQLALINNIGRQIPVVMELDSLLKRAARLVQEMFDYHHVALFLVDGDLLRLKGVAGSYEPHFPAGHTQQKNEGINGWVATNGAKLVANDVTAESRYISLIADHTITQSELCLPIKVAQTTVGVLDIQSPHLNTFSENDIVAMEAFANQIAAAIENARLYEAAQAELRERERAQKALKIRTHQQTVIAQLGQDALAGQNISEFFEQAVNVVVQTLAVDFCTILKLLPAENVLLLQTGAGWSDGVIGTTIDAGPRSQAGYTLLTNKPVIVENMAAETRFSKPQPLVDHGVTSGMSIIIQSSAHGQPFGALAVHAKNHRTFTEDDVHFLQAVANIIAQTLERQHAHEALEQEKALLAERVDERTAELSQAVAELERAARLKDEFLANMSHELRTPLNAILGMAEILKEKVYGDLNAEQQQSVQYIEESGRHLLDLITDILDLAKIEAGKTELLIAPVVLDDVCQASLLFVKRTAQKKQINVSYELDPRAEIIHVDERRLKQILVNLLSNAAKFTPEGGRVGLEVAAYPDHRMVNFTIWDTGIGIDQEHMEKLFEPFVQIDSSLARQHEGTGLGLSLVYRLTEMHGGSVTVESEPGHGSRFTVSLPSKLLDAGEETAESSHRLDKAASPINPAATVILLAEDNEANIATLQTFLETQQYRLILARNGAEALERAREEAPDLILMDIQMPGMDGLEAIRHIRADPNLAHIPIIALTALAMPGDRERCLEAGANEYMSKPVGLKMLAKKIKTQLA